MLRILALVVVAAAALCSPASEPDSLVVPRTEAAPTLDGKLDEACWKYAVVRNFTQANTETPAEKPIEARLCCTQSMLFIGVLCSETNPPGLKASIKLRNEQVWTDDCIEIFIRSGTEKLSYEQFIINPLGTLEDVRHRDSKFNRNPKPKWNAKAFVGEESWSAEFAIPVADLELKQLVRGQLLGLKIGRQDHMPAKGQGALIWPPNVPYAGCEGFGRAFIEALNSLPDSDLTQRKLWNADEQFCQATGDGQARAIRLNSNGRYATASQELKLQPEAYYTLSAEIQSQLPIYMRVRAPQAEQKKKEPGRAFEIWSQKSEDYLPYATRFKTGPSGEALLILGVPEGAPAGTALIRNLAVTAQLPPETSGPAIALKAGAEALVVNKLRVSDCRSLRGFISAPVDGTVRSISWDGGQWEYNLHGGGAGVGYGYRNGDGLHLTLADGQGFNAVQIRGGVKARLVRDCSRYDDPDSGVEVFRFPGQALTSRAYFKEAIKASRLSFFDVSDGFIADCAFFRVAGKSLEPAANASLGRCYERSSSVPPQIKAQLESRFPADQRRLYGFTDRFPGKPIVGQAPVPEPRPRLKLLLEPDKAVHFFSERKLSGGLNAVGFNAQISGPAQPLPFTLTIHDPLNSRLELYGADFELDKTGPVQLICKFPAQVPPHDSGLWLTLKSPLPLELSDIEFNVYELPVASARAEALEYRKFLLRGFYAVMSEARPWGGFTSQVDLDYYLAHSTHPYQRLMKDIFKSLEQCRQLDPEGQDSVLRQYHQWLHRTIFQRSGPGLPPFPTRFDQIEGVPEWAALAHQAWMQAREVPKWWIEQRMVPNGEFGSAVGDDTDLLANFAPFPLFERDGIGGQVLAAAARLAQTAEEQTLEQGLNKHTTDALHAYEEGLNLEALMLWWFYGDPIYTRRCLIAGRSLEALTTVTARGHRHFKDYERQGAVDLRMQRPLGFDGDSGPLMWHPALEAAWYNRNPRVLKLLREWADSWLEHQRDGKYARLVDVKSDTDHELGLTPFPGAWGLTGAVHMALAEITGEQKYIQPYLDFLRQGGNDANVRGRVYELQQMGMLDVPRDTLAELTPENWQAALYLNGDKAGLIAALKHDIEELQRFPHMFTTVECFTDRVFLYPAINPCIAYTGGYVTRNKFNKNFGISWEGFGTDYAALVLANTRTHLKVLLCNLSDKPLEGTGQIWRLEHGRYSVKLGPDADGDDRPEHLERDESLELARGTRIGLRLAAKTVQVLELQQVAKLDDILTRPDVALSPLEIKVNQGKVTGVAHNIGAVDADNVLVALCNPKGQITSKKTLGRLLAPLDLTFKPQPFELSGVPEDSSGWSVVIDPEDRLSEIYEGNNRVSLKTGN